MATSSAHQRPAALPNLDLVRCSWAGGDALMQSYHDDEWGVPLHDDRALFELLTLEGAQAGLSWQTVLNKRDAYRKAFDGGMGVAEVRIRRQQAPERIEIACPHCLEGRFECFGNRRRVHVRPQGRPVLEPVLAGDDILDILEGACRRDDIGIGGMGETWQSLAQACDGLDLPGFVGPQEILRLQAKLTETGVLGQESGHGNPLSAGARRPPQQACGIASP